MDDAVAANAHLRTYLAAWEAQGKEPPAWHCPVTRDRLPAAWGAPVAPAGPAAEGPRAGPPADGRDLDAAVRCADESARLGERQPAIRRAGARAEAGERVEGGRDHRRRRGRQAPGDRQAVDRQGGVVAQQDRDRALHRVPAQAGPAVDLDRRERIELARVAHQQVGGGDGRRGVVAGGGDVPGATGRGGDVEPTTADLTPLYAEVAGRLSVGLDQLNLEGACVIGQSLRWFHRGIPAAGIPSSSVEVHTMHASEPD